MKSTIFALLPLAGFALAESVCQPKTITKTVYAYESEPSTSEAQVVKDEATPKPSAPVPQPSVPAPQPSVPVLSSSTCSRRTVTATAVEKVTVTITADDVTTTRTSTSTRYSTTTVTVRPSKAPAMSSPAAVPVASSKPVATPAASATSSLPDFMLVGSSKPAANYVAKPSTAAAASPSETKGNQQPAASASPSPNNGGTPSGVSSSGDATFYGGNIGGGMCSFTGYTLPSGVFGTALSDSNWAGAQACGQCVKVTGPDGTKITAMVVDQCPGCGPNHLDLFPDAFAKLAEPSKGIIKVSWEYVPCGITGPIVLKNKSGTSKFWFSMQVVNANVGVSKLEVSTDGGSTWKPTTRQPYNYFENSSGFGTDSVDVKVTSIDGKTIVVKGVSVADSSTKTASGNF